MTVKHRPTTLLILTQTYPWDGAGERTFIDPELERLRDAFDRVLVIPAQRHGSRDPVPDGIVVDESYADSMPGMFRKLRRLSSSLRSSLLYSDIARQPTMFLRPSAMKMLIHFVSGAEHAKGWLPEFIARNRVDVERTVVFTYWLDQIALGIGLAKQAIPDLRLVSRAHGYDLYEERHEPAYIPLRAQTLRGLDHLFLASDEGRKYVTKRYPWLPAAKTSVARLGVKDPGFLASPSTDGVWRVVSCAYTVAVKRIDLLAQGLECAARSRPGQQFEWHHIGSGSDLARVQAVARRILPDNVSCFFRGHMPNEDVMAFYRDTPVDVFVNVSQSEGGCPVTIQEAASCGIPIIASGVGGNPEIVSDANGRIMPKDPSPGEIGAALLDLLDDPEGARRKRAASRQVWRQKVNAEVNGQRFAQGLAALVE